MVRTGLTSVWAAMIMLHPALTRFSAAQDEPSAAIFADWTKRQKAYKSIRIQAEGTVTITPEYLSGSDSKVNYKEAISKPESFTLLIDCETGRARFDLKTSLPSGADGLPRKFNRSFVMQKDQAIVKFQRTENAISGDDSNRDRPDLSFMKLDHCEFPTLDVMPILWNLGRVSLPNREILGRKIWSDIEYDAGMFDSIVAESPTLVRLKSTPLNPPNSSVFHEILVNPTLKYAITSVKMQGGLTREFQLKYDLKDHPRLPSEWSYSFKLKDKAWRAHTQKVTSVEINPLVKDSDFDFPLEPGQLVSTRQNKLQRVSASGSLVDLVGEEAERERKRRALAKQITDRHPELRVRDEEDRHQTNKEDIHQAKEVDTPQNSFLLIAGLALSGILVLTAIIIVFRRQKAE